MEYDVGLLLRLAHRRAAAAFAEALKPLGVENRHFGVLLTLRRLGPLSQRQLIDAIGSDKSSMVRTIDDLEQRGLARRSPVPGDRRTHAVELTPAGRDLLTRGEHIADRVSTDLLANLHPDEQRTLRELLSRFIGTDNLGPAAARARGRS